MPEEFNNFDIASNYVTWLKSEITTRRIDDRVSQVTTPFLDRHNDYIQIYVQQLERNNEYRLSDDGYIISDLEMSGIQLDTSSRRKFLMQTIDGFGVKIGDYSDLFIEANQMDFAQKKHALIQCMLAVDDLYVTGRSAVQSMFREDVRGFLDHNDIRFSEDIDVLGRSGYYHKYEFLISKSKNRPERLIKAVNKLSSQTTQNILFAWNETIEKRNESVLYAIVNDENSVPQESVAAFEKYGAKIIPFSLRDNFIEELSS